MSIDQPRDVREGEELPMERLTPFLVDHIPGFSGPVEVRQFPSGYSNLTYFLKSSDGSEYVLRRPPFGANIKSGHDMSREWNVLSALSPVFSKAPSPFVNCTDPDVIGAPFYVMERVQGVILRGAAPNVDGLDEASMSQACHALIDTMAEIHAIDLEAANLTEFGRPEGYVQRQVEGWTRRWEKSKTDDIPAVELAAKWLNDNRPDDLPGALIHNDFKYDNVVYAHGDFSTVAAVLDWEMTTVGDPLMDLGTSLAYWIEEGDDPVLQSVAGPTAHPGNLTRQGVASYYAEKTGRDISDILFYYVFGLFKVAVIGQQIYARFKQGHSSDPRFGGLIFLVNAAGERAAEALSAKDI